jgi:hypothetical protein
MKRNVFVALLALVLMTGTVFAQVSVQAYKQVPAETMINASRDAINVLVIRDELPWGDNVTVPILQGMGATVSTATSGTYPAMDFSGYTKIVVESVQNQNFYNVFQANLAKFTTYVTNGGVLQINGCTQGIAFNLPGGASSVLEYSDDGYHALPGHPFLVGVPDPFFGDWANHNGIANLPAGAVIITRDIPQNFPTTVTYQIGSGTVIASGLTLEIAYYFELNNFGSFNFGLDMYPNMLGYLLEPPEAVPVAGWALAIGIALIAGLAFLRYRRIV